MMQFSENADDFGGIRAFSDLPKKNVTDHLSTSHLAVCDQNALRTCIICPSQSIASKQRRPACETLKVELRDFQIHFCLPTSCP